MIDPFYIPDLALVIIGILTIAAAITAIEAQEIVYGAISLAAMFLGIAGLFVLLDATYAAMFQISVYIGAIAVLALFTIMVVPYEQWRYRLERPIREWLIPAVINLLLLSALLFTILTPTTVSLQPPEWSWTITELAFTILNTHGVALLILGIVLAMALMGALSLTTQEEQG